MDKKLAKILKNKYNLSDDEVASFEEELAEKKDGEEEAKKEEKEKEEEQPKKEEKADEKAEEPAEEKPKEEKEEPAKNKEYEDILVALKDEVSELKKQFEKTKPFGGQPKNEDRGQGKKEYDYDAVMSELKGQKY